MVRELRGLEVQEMNRRLGSTSYSYYESLEERPKFEKVVRLAEALDLRLDCLFYYNNYIAVMTADYLDKHPFVPLVEYSFEKREREIRSEKHLTQTDVADRVGVTKATYRQYIHGKQFPPKEKIVRLIADALGVSPEELYPLMEPMPEPVEAADAEISPDAEEKRLPSKGLTFSKSYMDDGTTVLEFRIPPEADREGIIDDAIKIFKSLMT